MFYNFVLCIAVTRYNIINLIFLLLLGHIVESVKISSSSGYNYMDLG